MNGTDGVVGMLGHDFARELVAHWLEIRGGDLVPARRRLDPTRLAKSLSRIWLGEYVPPDRYHFLLAGDEIRNRVEERLKGANFFDLADPRDRAAAMERLRLLFAVPCGAHYQYRILLGEQCVEEIEALVLPLCREPGQAPDLSITVTHRTGGRGLTEFDDRNARIVRDTAHRFIDIGAGLPDQAGRQERD